MILRPYEDLKPFTEKRVLVRCNFDVSIEDGEVKKDSSWRIDASLPLLMELSSAGALTTVVSHLGRPEGADERFTLQPVVNYLSSRGLSVTLGNSVPQKGEIVVQENLRFNPGEEQNDGTFVKNLAELGDIFINDDFATAHRAHASTVGVAKVLPSVAGPLLLREVAELTRAREIGGEGLVVIIGGAKAETKVKLVSYFIDKGATVLSGGVIANTILKLRGISVGKSLIDTSTIPEAVFSSPNLTVPTDAIVSTSLEKAENMSQKEITNIGEGEYILDLGEGSQKIYADAIRKATYIIWNGPLGLVETAEFRLGSKTIGKACAESQAYKLAGGGDIVTFLSQEGMRETFNYVSTGGGAMLSYLAGEELPALEVLKK